MVVKKCPICDQTLPVACKSCHCGHVFVSRKQLMPTQDKTEVGDGNQRDQRLRPEIPKREIKDYEYDYGSKVEMQPGEPIERSMITTQMYLSESSIPDLGHDVGRTEDMRNYLAATASRPMSEILHLPDGYSSSKRKRGRPKGSKNKPKPILQPGEEIAHDDSHTNGQNSESGDSAKRKRGRPKGSKNKPKDPSLLKAKSASTDGWSSDTPESQDSYHEPYVDRMPLITKDKAISYSIVLSDINQKMMKQSSMNFV